MARNMKDSGIEWIGEIPEGWEVSQLKYATRWKSEKGCPDAPVLSLYRDFGVVPKDSRDDNHNVTSLDTSNYKVVDIGDLVINKMKAWQGSMAVSDYRGIVSPAYHVCSITSNKVNKRYLHHLLRNPAYLPEYSRLSTGMRIGQWDLGFDDFKNIPFLIPPLDEQAKIADYLDNGCASLDAMLSKTRSSIEEYKKLKQAVITQAVTKGVRGEREMKDSGVEWIGEIPTTYSICKLKYLLKNPLKYGANESGIPYSDSLPRYIRITDITPDGNLKYTGKLSLSEESAKDYILEDGDILFARSGATVGKTFIYYQSYGRSAYAGYLIKASLNNKVSPKFVYYYTCSSLYEIWKNSIFIQSTIQNIGADRYANLPVPVPKTLQEQEEIADYLDAKCAEIDKLIAKKEQLVKELESYKKSLIYEVVTGKREIFH